MRKILILLSAGVLALSMAACGASEKPTTSEPSPDAATQTSDTITTGEDTQTEQSPLTEETATTSEDTAQENNTEQTAE